MAACMVCAMLRSGMIFSGCGTLMPIGRGPVRQDA
jgi:hypothetical protein